MTFQENNSNFLFNSYPYVPVTWFPVGKRELAENKYRKLHADGVRMIRIGIDYNNGISKRKTNWYRGLLTTLREEFEVEPCFIKSPSRDFSLQHLGFTIPPQADCGWIGEAGPGPSYGDTEWQGKPIDPPKGFDSDFTNRNVTFMTYNLMHLASALKRQGGYPAYGNSAEEWKNGKRWEFKKPGTGSS